MPIIEFQNADLRYPIREHHGMTLKEFLLRGLFWSSRSRSKQLHALRDLSFRIEEGERVGILGNNGAGKSTLLRTIAGVYPIDQGRRLVDGSVCSLLDYTVGFEPEATGWQNIYYRGYLQGETPTTMRAKLQNIAEFTELGPYLDMPIRCYSTGMVLRLAFAIATSSEPEILLLDEFFFTSDLGFRQRGERRLREFMHKAKIVVMVGHDLAFLKEFCTRVLWLHQGRLIADGPPWDVVPEYEERSLATALPVAIR